MSTFTHHLYDYTDEHDVDENMTVIFIHGGRWENGSNAGITRRAMDDAPTTSGSSWFASKGDKD